MIGPKDMADPQDMMSMNPQDMIGPQDMIQPKPEEPEQIKPKSQGADNSVKNQKKELHKFLMQKETDIKLVVKQSRKGISEELLQKAFDMSVTHIISDFQPDKDKEKILHEFLTKNLEKIVEKL